MTTQDKLEVLYDNFLNVDSSLVEIQLEQKVSLDEAIELLWFDCAEDLKDAGADTMTPEERNR